MTDIVPPDDRISAYLDGALSATEHYEVQQLLVASPEWRKELDEVSWARVTVRAMPARVAPTGFFENLLRDGLEERELRKESKAQPKRMRGRSTRSARRGGAHEVEPVEAEDFVAAEDSVGIDDDVDALGVPHHDRADLPHTIEEMPFAAASPSASAPPAPVVDDLDDQWSRPPYHDPYDDLHAESFDEPAVAASPPVAAGPPPPPGDPDVVAPAVAFRPQAEPSGLPTTPQPAPDDPFEQLLPEGPLSWERPVAPPAPPAPAAPAPRQTRRDIVAAKDAALTPRPVRRDEGDDTTPWGKPVPRRRPLRDAAVEAVAVEAVAEVEAPASVPTPPVLPEPISLDAARSVRSRRALRWVAGAAAAAAVVIAAVVVPPRGSVDPRVPEFAGAHSVRSSVTDDPVMQLASAPLAFGR